MATPTAARPAPVGTCAMSDAAMFTPAACACISGVIAGDRAVNRGGEGDISAGGWSQSLEGCVVITNRVPNR